LIDINDISKNCDDNHEKQLYKVFIFC